jgi:hypothetical protein
MIDSAEQVLPLSDEDYISLRHFVVSGSDHEIGRDLGQLGRSDYDVVLQQYDDPVYARARSDYFEALWPAMAERMRGVADAFDVDADTTDLDLSCLKYDAGGSGCSAVFIPPSLSADGHAMVGRNYDYFACTTSELSGHDPKPGELPFNKRSYALEMRAENSHAFLGLAGLDLLNPWLDGINDAGLFITVLMDPSAPASHLIHWGGGRDSGLSQVQMPALLMQTCATVADAKRALLHHRIFAPGAGLHTLIADAEGAATVFEVDHDTGDFVFTDAAPDLPLVVTNHPVHEYPTRDSFPSFEPTAEHNTFNRMCMLDDAIEQHTGKFTREDLQALINIVNCAFVDQKKAQVGVPTAPERTLWTYTADLATKDLVATFYLGDTEPIEGTNHMGTRRSAPVTLSV